MSNQFTFQKWLTMMAYGLFHIILFIVCSSGVIIESERWEMFCDVGPIVVIWLQVSSEQWNSVVTALKSNLPPLILQKFKPHENIAAIQCVMKGLCVGFPLPNHTFTALVFFTCRSEWYIALCALWFQRLYCWIFE